MTDGIRYEVAIDYVARGDLSAPAMKLGALTQRIGTAQGALSGLGGKISDAFGGAISTATSGFDALASRAVSAFTSVAEAAGGALAVGMGEGIATGIKFNDQVEQIGIGLATLAHTQLGVDMAEGLKQSQSVIATMKKDAASLPGEFQDLAGIMASLSAPAMSHGMAMPDVEKLSSRVMVSAAVNQVPFQVAARQLGRALEGHVTSAMKFPQRLGLGTELNKLSYDERLKRIQAALGKSDVALPYFQNSFTGLYSTLKDLRKQTMAGITAPLFETLKDDMGRVSQYWDSHQAQIQRVTDYLGERLNAAYVSARDELRSWVPVAVAFGHTLAGAIDGAFARVRPYLHDIDETAKRFLSSPDALKRIESGAGLLAGTRVGLGVLGKAPGLLGSVGDLAGAGGAAALGEASVVALPAIVAIGVAAGGAADALLDAKSQFHAVALDLVSKMGKNIEDIGRVTGELAVTLRPVAQMFGTLMIAEIQNMTNALALGANTIESLFSKLGLLQIHGERHAGLTPKEGVSYSAPSMKYNPSSAPNAPNHITHIHNLTIQNTINGEADPDRVAIAIKDLFRREARNPTGRSSNPNAKFTDR